MIAISIDQSKCIFALLAARLFNFNFHSLEVVSRWRDPQLKVCENYSDFYKMEVNYF